MASDDSEQDRFVRDHWGTTPPASPQLRRRVLSSLEAEPRVARTRPWVFRVGFASALAAALVCAVVLRRPHRVTVAAPGEPIGWTDDTDDAPDETAMFDLAALSDP